MPSYIRMTRSQFIIRIKKNKAIIKKNILLLNNLLPEKLGVFWVTGEELRDRLVHSGVQSSLSLKIVQESVAEEGRGGLKAMMDMTDMNRDDLRDNVIEHLQELYDVHKNTSALYVLKALDTELVLDDADTPIKKKLKVSHDGGVVALVAGEERKVEDGKVSLAESGGNGGAVDEGLTGGSEKGGAVVGVHAKTGAEMKRNIAALKMKSKNDEKDHKAKIYELSTDMKGGIERLQQKHMKSLLNSADFMFTAIVLADSKAGTDWNKEENLKLMKDLIADLSAKLIPLGLNLPSFATTTYGHIIEKYPFILDQFEKE